MLDVGNEKAGILPSDTRFFCDFWTLGGHARQPEAWGIRESIYKNALSAVDGRNAVFLDPDNGIHPGPLGRTRLPGKLKYVLWSEARGFYGEGARTLILIQFLNRWRNAGSPARQTNNRRGNLRDALQTVRNNDIRTLLFCFRGCSGGANPNPRNGPPLVFFILPGSGHETWIDKRLSKLAAHKHWRRFVSLGGGSKPKGVAPGLCRRCDACEA